MFNKKKKEAEKKAPMSAEEVRRLAPQLLTDAMKPILDGRFYEAFNEAGARRYVDYIYTFCKQPVPKQFYVVENPKEALILAREIMKNPDFTYPLFFACSLYTTPYLTWHKFFIDNVMPDYEQAHVITEMYELWQDANIFAAVLEDDFAIVSKGALKIHIWQDLLHNDMGPAIEFSYKMHAMDDCYFWKNTLVPEQLIMRPETITRKELLAIENAEMRRCYMEAMGSLYFDIIGVTPISEETDAKGNAMKLYKTKFPLGNDSQEVPLQILSVIDPSSGRQYTLYPPQQNGEQYKTAEAAKWATFSNKPIAYRQGDVGLVNLDINYERPLIET